MSRTYQATGINLKGMPMGESDRLLTILTREYGLIRAIAPGARKHQSRLGGRSGLFVVNHLFLAQGRSLDKITQAETIASYPGLSQNLSKLTVSQYLAELVLFQALSNQPQEELFCLVEEHLTRLERHPHPRSGNKIPQKSGSPLDWPVLALLIQAMFHLLALAGLAPQTHACCISQSPLEPNFDHPEWQAGFSVMAGGAVNLAARPQVTLKLNALELTVLQHLAQPDLSSLAATISDPIPLTTWQTLERTLRQYVQYHFDRPIRSATLIDTCLLSVPSEAGNHAPTL